MFKSRLRKGGAIVTMALMLIGGFEGLKTAAYKDSVGVPTICYGDTLDVHIGDVKTVQECKDLLAERLPVFERGMAECIIEPDRVPDESYIAFLSFTYNVGVSAFCHSTLVKKLNQGDLVGACNELPKWVYAGGKKLPGLVTRRAKEQELCLSAQPVNTIPFWVFIAAGIAIVGGVVFATRKHARRNSGTSGKRSGTSEIASVGVDNQNSSGS